MGRVVTAKGTSEITFKIVSYTVVTLFALMCLLPVALTLSSSLTTEEAIYEHGYSLVPKVVSLQAYEIVFKSPKGLLNAFAVSMLLAVFGTALSLAVTSMTAYVIWRKDFPFKKQLSFFIYFTSIFAGGLVPLYIWLVRYLHLKNTIWALMLPNLTSAWNILIFRSFLKSVPDSLVESAKIDGAGDFWIFLKIIMPISTPGLAVVGMFQALYYWNDWYLAMLYIDTDKLYPLQFFLYKVLNNLQALQNAIASSGIPIPDMPSQTLKMAITMLVALPVFFVFPVIQRYLVKGITIGSVKG